MMAMADRAKTRGAKAWEASGNMGRLKRRKP